MYFNPFIKYEMRCLMNYHDKYAAMLQEYRQVFETFDPSQIDDQKI